ncbi:hypothetical protein XENORESO_006911 [Xenotaenia resolanae]|uniref:Nucleolar protein 4 n=1 Tax=Xenotaenia resolanae TaxID=208358 RepID=A0ABV0WRB2_9TELE
MTTRKPAGVVGDMVPISKLQTQTQQSSRSPVGGDGVPAEAAEMVGEFRDWCLKTYGDSGKTKTVTRRKYNKILQTLLQEGEEDGGAALLQEKEAGSHHINAKFKFWVRSKGFQVDRSGPSSSDGPVLYVPIKATICHSERDVTFLQQLSIRQPLCLHTDTCTAVMCVHVSTTGCET